jgi:hypothetical protein
VGEKDRGLTFDRVADRASRIANVGSCEPQRKDQQMERKCDRKIAHPRAVGRRSTRKGFNLSRSKVHDMSTTLDTECSREEWTRAGSSAADAAAATGAMTGHAVNAVGAAAMETVQDMGRGADDLAARAGGGIEHLGQMLAEKSPTSGPLGVASQAVAQSLQRGGKCLEETKLSGTPEMLSELIRQNPLAAVLTGLVTGYLLARAMKE